MSTWRSPVASQPACYLCGSTALTRRAPNREYAFVRCQRCGFRRQDPVPDPDSLNVLYHSEFYQDRGLDRTLDDLPRFARELLADRLERLTGATGKPGRLLDVGCGTGLFVEAARRAGWEVRGTETSEDSIRYARKFTPAPIFHGELGSLDDDTTYDALTYWDVLEHLPDPRAELQLSRQRLNPGGVVGVSLPSVQGLKANLQGDAWRYYAPSMGHLSHFTPKTLSMLLTQAGFTMLEVRTHGAVNLWKILGEDPLSVRESRPALHLIQEVADAAAGAIGMGETITALARR
jgi:2-polyprenyl-3-methyl-5-hydroxy-6-metoxy-1,4-benzoquinol methylase